MASNWTVTRVEQRENLTAQGDFEPYYRVWWIYNPTGTQYYVDVAKRDYTDSNVQSLINDAVSTMDAVHNLSG
jgi:hypothetical protein